MATLSAQPRDVSRLAITFHRRGQSELDAFREVVDGGVKVLPVAVAAVALKYACHLLGWEVISLSPLFSGLLAATFFLLGFLLSGVLTDYKESEKLPGEMAVSLEAIADEAEYLYRTRRLAPARAVLRHLAALAGAMRDWFYGRATTVDLLDGVTALNDHFVALDADAPPNFLVRMKQEQSALRASVIRIQTVRETSFVLPAYAIAEIAATLLVIGFLLARIDPFYESLFFVGLIAFVFTYMIALIRDLDDPVRVRRAGRGRRRGVAEAPGGRDRAAGAGPGCGDAGEAMTARGTRVIAHVDMDAFYASVEIRDDPSLAGRPVVVGGSAPGRGVVAAASYEARKYGVHSAMPMARAERLCPRLVRSSRRLRQVPRRLGADHGDPRALLARDRAALARRGVSRPDRHRAAARRPADTVGRNIKDAIREETRLTASVGIAPVKFVAKIASDLEKPDGLVVVEPGTVAAFLRRCAIGRLWGVGPRTREALEALGIRTDRRPGRRATGSRWYARFGAHGEHLQDLARGLDERDVVPDWDAKSYSHEETFARDRTDAEYLESVLLDQALRVSRRLRRDGVRRPDRAAQAALPRLPHDHPPRDAPGADRRHRARSTPRAPRSSTRTGTRAPIRLIGLGVSGIAPAGGGAARSLRRAAPSATGAGGSPRRSIGSRSASAAGRSCRRRCCGGASPRGATDVLERLPPAERAQLFRVLAHVAHDLRRIGPGVLPQRPADRLAHEELAVRQVGHDAVVEQLEVGVGLEGRAGRGSRRAASRGRRNGSTAACAAASPPDSAAATDRADRRRCRRRSPTRRR